MRTWWLSLLVLLSCLALPAQAGPTPKVMSIIEWMNHETRMSDLIVLGQVSSDAAPHAQSGEVRAVLKVGEIFHGPRVGPMVLVTIKSGYRGGQYTVPAPLLKDQWVLIWLRSEGGRWVAPPVGRVVETPYKGLTFYPGYNIVLSDASPSLSWDYVLDSLSQLVATRREIINGHMPALRAASTTEQRDRVKLNIEWQVKEHLGLPVP